MARKLTIALLGLGLIAAAIWRSAPSVGADEVLVVSDRSVAGPARIWIAPWAPRAMLPRRVEAESAAELDLGQGSTWPVNLRAAIELDPSRMEEPARQALLDGRLGERLTEWARIGLADIKEQPGFDPRATLFEPGAVQAALQEALAPIVPPGIHVALVEALVQVPDNAVRANALTAARGNGTEPVSRVLYVGLDGADWNIIDPLIARGELPVLGRLVREGVRADLLSYEPIMSPLLWTTAITGRGPDEHGIFDFTLADADGNQVPISSKFRQAPAIWEILSAWGESSAFVNFWASHPTEEIDGVLVSDIADALLRDANQGVDLPAGAVWPAGFLESVQGLWTYDDVPLSALRRYVPSATAAELARWTSYWNDKGAQAAFAEGKGPDERKTPPFAFLTQAITNSHNLERITDELLRRSDLGVVGVYFGEIDQIGHGFQHLAPPPHPLADPEEHRFAEVVVNSYRMQDAMLGRLVEAAGPATVVLIHSDHGFRWGVDRPRDTLPFTRGQPVEWHRLQGVFVAAGGPVRRGARVEDVTLYDIAPTLLALRGVPAPETMPGRVRHDLFEPAAAARLPQTRIPDWDSILAPRRYADAGDGESLDALRGEMVEQLRALGYVGGVSDEEQEPGGEPQAVTAGEERPQMTYYRTKATWLMNENRFAEAEQALLEANRLKPMPKTYSLLSEALAAQGALAQAAKALDEGLEKFPDEMPASAVLWQVELHLERGDHRAARQSLEQAQTARGPQAAAPFIVAQGRLAEASGDREAARQAYLRALEMDPREVRAAQRYAGLATSAAERAELEPYLQRALERDPRIEIYWQMLALVYIDRGDPARAADAFGRAADLEPQNEAHRLNEALAALQDGQHRRASRLFETLATQGSRQPAVWVNLGRLRAAAGQWSGARSAWERAVELGANAPGLQDALTEARRRSGES